MKKASKIIEQVLKITANSLFDDLNRKIADYKHEFKREIWMKIEDDDKVEEYQELQNGGYIEKVENDERIDDDGNSKIERMPLHLGVFSSNSKPILEHL